MQKSMTLRKIIPFIAIILMVAIVALSISFAHAFGASAADNKGEGNNVGSGKADISLILDVNGRDASNSQLRTTCADANYTSETVNDFIKNDAQHLKVRYISASAVVKAYAARHEEKEANNYSFVEGTVYCDAPEIEVALVGEMNMTVTAKSKTRTADGVRFSVVMANGYEKDDENYDSFPVNFSVVVRDTFAQWYAKSEGGLFDDRNTARVRVGGVINESGEEQKSTLTINNYSDWQFELSDYLVNRVLYINDTNDTKYTKAVRMYDDAAAPYWTISSANNFKVQDVSFANNGFTDFSANNPSAEDKTQHSASVSTTLSLSTAKVNAYVANQLDIDSGYNVDKFWAETHDVEVSINTVEDNGKSNLMIILIPVKFRSDEPQSKAIPSAYLNLTVTSEYICDYNGGLTVYKDKDGNTVDRDIISTVGYGSIIIRPTDLVDYCFPSEMDGIKARLSFFHEETDKGSENGDYRLEIYEAEENREMYPNAYRVVGQRNGQYAINFSIRYYVEGGGGTTYRTKNVLVSINGDGAYTVNIPSIEGKDAVTYNVMSASQFKQLREAHYIMTDAVSDNKTQLDVSFKNNQLRLKPNVDKIKGTTQATITMTFTHTNGQKLVIKSNSFGIDINAGSFWSKFEDWEAWLIIAAMIIGGIAIILLIVWIFIHSISKHKQAENATQAPVSSYIVKLNSTIAATQAQQRLAATQALAQASSQMLLGAGPTGTPAAPPDALQLTTGLPSAPQATDSTGVTNEPVMSAPKEPEENYDELIAQYISDEELLERIFVEKYEPKGMVRRTFFKSKDLQARELDKEKKRIIERYKSPMPMDEAIMSEAEINKSAATEPATSAPQETVEEAAPTEVFVLDFDPETPLYVEAQLEDEFAAEKIDLDVAPEESALKDAEHRNLIIEKELAELKSRIDKVQKELDKNKSLEETLREKIAKAENDDEGFAKDIEDLEFKLATAKQKEKDKITRDINITETKKKRNLDNLEKLRAELDALLGGGTKLGDIMVSLNATKESKLAEQSGIVADKEKAQADFDAYQERLAKVKARQELESKIEGLNPMLVAVNNADYEMRAIDSAADVLEKERDKLKSEVAAAKTQILSANDFDLINELNTKISESNARLSEIEKETTKSTKHRSEINLEFTAQRRKANDYVEKNDIPLEDVIAAEDLVVGNIELENLRAAREKDRDVAENLVAAAQAEFDDISASATDVTMVAMEIASDIQQLEADLEVAQGELDAINAQMETASDDEKLMLMVDQGDKSDKVDEIKQKIEQANIEGTKRKIEAQAQYDERVEAAHAKLDEATEEFKTASAKYDILADTNPLDLIMSGCGIISQDQKKIEATNLKKQLEKSKNEIEQARLAAEMAQMAAEQAKVDAARASDEARAEAERKAQEAIEAAERARIEAEEKAQAEVEAASQSRREAEEAAERARLEAEEATERVRREAEEAAERARVEAEEAAERARKEAEEVAERARIEAEEKAEASKQEAEQAKREAMEAAERVRKEAAEALQAEAEEAKRKAQEEIEEMRRKAEEEAEAKRLEAEQAKREEEERQKAEESRKEAIAAKIAARKEKIVVIRERMKDIKGDEDAKSLREQLYTQQLTFDEDEKGSVELMDFYNKTMDDIQHAGEVATLKAENAKKPKRVVKKVTERVNRIPKKKAKPGARPARPAGARPRPAGARPARPAGARPARPAGAKRPSSGARPGSRPPRSR